MTKPMVKLHKPLSNTIEGSTHSTAMSNRKIGRSNTGRIRIPMGMFRNPLQTSQYAQKIIHHENKIKLQKKLTLQMELQEKFEMEQFAMSVKSERHTMALQGG